ncbi:unnamed protein product [Prunus armeniaca]
MASSVKAEGCKKEELSFSSCNNCKGFSIFRVGDAVVAVVEEVKKNNHVVRKLVKRQQICTLHQPEQLEMC